ncbi:14-3-3 protein 9, partial [Genlisea aurea]
GSAMADSSERETALYVAKLAEQAERYRDIAEEMKKVARMGVELTAEERNLFSVGYKNFVGSRRASWRILSSIEKKERNEQNINRIKELRQKVESEVAGICNETISVLDEHLIPSCPPGENFVFYHKMKGDYYRYLAEFNTGSFKEEVADLSQKSYEVATESAEAELPPTNSVRLGVALNFSVFLYEIRNSSERACSIAKQAIDEAIASYDFDAVMEDESNKDVNMILQLIRDNLVLWTAG